MGCIDGRVVSRSFAGYFSSIVQEIWWAQGYWGFTHFCRSPSSSPGPPSVGLATANLHHASALAGLLCCCSWVSGKTLVEGFVQAYGNLYKVPGELGAKLVVCMYRFCYVA